MGALHLLHDRQKLSVCHTPKLTVGDKVCLVEFVGPACLEIGSPSVASIKTL